MLSAASIEYSVRREKFVGPNDVVVRQAQIDLGNRLPRLPDAPEVNWRTPRLVFNRLCWGSSNYLIPKGIAILM